MITKRMSADYDEALGYDRDDDSEDDGESDYVDSLL